MSERMDAYKLQVKVFVDTPAMLDLELFVPVFHGWVREHRLDELLIDVADYRHVSDGPGVVLVGHESHYAIDQADGRPGLQYSRKREGELAPKDRIADAFRRVLFASRLLEAESSLGPLRFRTDEFLFRISDRLRAPNTSQTHATVRPALESFATRLFAGAAFSLEQRGTPKEQYGVHISAPEAPGLDTLIERING